MTALKDLSQNATIPTAGFADKSATGPALHLDSQVIYGDEEAWKTGLTGNPAVLRSTGNLLQILYTPPVNCMLDVACDLWLSCQTAAWHTAYGQFNCSPAPGFGPPNQYQIGSEHNSASGGLGARVMRAKFYLTASTAYTIQPYLSIDSGTWSYHMGASVMRLRSHAWAR